ncbi:MAG: hypothetical protein GXN98_03460 [Euryarchaeota archaeon]|nr:hypothetical protein [Euryarchaeota archaeon]
MSADVIYIRPEDIERIRGVQGEKVPLYTRDGKVVNVDAEKVGKAIEKARSSKLQGSNETYVYVKYGRYVIAVKTDEVDDILDKLIKVINTTGKTLEGVINTAGKTITEAAPAIIMIILSIKSDKIIKEIGNLRRK